MNKVQKAKYFILGVVLTLLICNVVVPVVATTIDVVFNSVNITMNGKQIAKSGENYKLENGSEVPYSIMYNGTTYLPLRKIGEIYGKIIEWDGATSTVSVNDSDWVNPNTVQEKSIPITDLTQFSGSGFSQGASFKVRQEEIYASNKYNAPKSWYNENKTTYLLDQKYKTLKGTVAFIDGSHTGDNYRLLKITGDGQVLCRLYMYTGNQPYEFEVDVSNVSSLTIECGQSLSFYNVTLIEGNSTYNDGTTPLHLLKPYTGNGFNAGKYTFTIRQESVEMYNKYDVPKSWYSDNKTTYILDKKYKTIKGMVAFADGHHTGSNYRLLKITGDGKVLYSGHVEENSKAIEITVNVTDIDQLTIEGGNSVYFYNVTISE